MDHSLSKLKGPLLFRFWLPRDDQKHSIGKVARTSYSRKWSGRTILVAKYAIFIAV